MVKKVTPTQDRSSPKGKPVSPFSPRTPIQKHARTRGQREKICQLIRKNKNSPSPKRKSPRLDPLSNGLPMHFQKDSKRRKELKE